MSDQYEIAPGAPAPVSGIFELLNVLGSPTGTQVLRLAGDALPPAPVGWTWRRIEGDTSEGAEILHSLQALLASLRAKGGQSG